MMKTLCALLMALHAFLFAHFHGQQAKSEFEVASVHPTPPSQEHGMSLSLKLDASQVRVIALPLRDIIATAYRVKPYQISGPDWIATTPFDVSAKMPAGATIRQVPDMLQSLLVDRFGLVLHREKKEFPVYALVLGKGPLKLRAQATDGEAAADRLTWSLSGNPAGVSNVVGDGSSYSFAGGKFEGKKLTVAALATELERYSPRPILDMTRLTGAFDVTFTVNPEAYGQLLARAAINSGMVMPAQMRIQIESNTDFNALPEAVEQLGLKLDSRRMPIDMLVVDDVRKTPTEN
jgi:uncharacterized protein (TIGR03435 family)